MAESNKTYILKKNSEVIVINRTDILKLLKESETKTLVGLLDNYIAILQII